ncbi:hypothetical protein FGG08_000193 [Glutinoglossum americanum]|uniref:Uncharacterized protein n=1 Tax=Glutinoglossum americanum TaxID=1670608 RepID=A0A9P8IDT5_9PEZI|nr:hypothetical protein FGG08_000193 [Glutinoglossum americanum]
MFRNDRPPTPTTFLVQSTEADAMNAQPGRPEGVGESTSPTIPGLEEFLKELKAKRSKIEIKHVETTLQLWKSPG